MSIPFWQYPHCGTCTSIHACCNGCRAGLAAAVPRSLAHNAGSPSSVVIALPLTAATGVTHERISLPSRSTEQAPHCAKPQPKRGPCRRSSLCRTYRRGVSRLAVTLCTRPFTLIFNLLAIPPSQSEDALTHVAKRRSPSRDDLSVTIRPRAAEYKMPSTGSLLWRVGGDFA